MDALAELYLAHAGWFWAALAAGLLAVEIGSGTGWLLWAAAAAAVVAVVEAFTQIPFAAAVLLFVVLVIVSTLTARRYFPRRLAGQAPDINDNLARLIGQEARVVSAFERGEGRVFVDGKEWAAELDGAEALEAGARVRVDGVAGARLRVRALAPGNR